MHIHRTVSREFRRYLAEAYPGLGNNPAYWNLAGYLLFGTHCDKDTGKRLLSAPTCAAMEGKEKQQEARNYVAEEFLVRFNRDVLRPQKQELVWGNWSYMDERSRVVEALSLSPETLAMQEAERRRDFKDTGRVFLSDGKDWTPAKQASLTNDRRRAAQAKIQYAQCEDAKALLEYTSSQPGNIHTRLLRNYDWVYRQAEIYDRSRVPKNPEHPGRFQTDVLHVVLDNPQPFYTPSPNTVRAFGMGETYLSLKSHLRGLYCDGWTDLDLKSSQLAIVAEKWDVPEIRELLAGGNSVWTYLCDGVGLLESDATKAVCKRSLYSLIYGMTCPNLATNIFAASGVAEAGTRFLAIPNVQVLLSARTEQQKRIWKEGGMRDCYGRWLSTDVYSARSILAQVSQSWEMYLLSPVIQAARANTGNRGFVLSAWQHDGFSIHTRRSDETDKWTGRLCAMVNARAEQQGILTRLEVTRPGAA